jgi:hypothetical protein
MTTLPNQPDSSRGSDGPLRLELFESAPPEGPDGAWWPRSRSLQTEAGVLIDNFPLEVGRINRMLFSRPDWDDGTIVSGGGRRRITARRGPVKVGSFPTDDTHLMVLSMANGRRLRLQVVPSDTEGAEARRILAGT